MSPFGGVYHIPSITDMVLPTSIPTMTERATAWSVTINLKTVSKDTAAQCMETAKSLGWGVQGQLERGEQGTEHYQLMVRTPQVRFSSVKKVFPTAHIEACRNFQALSRLC